MSFLKGAAESGERIYTNIMHYQQNGRPLAPEYYGAIKNAMPEEIDMLTAMSVAEAVDEAAGSEKRGTIIGCIVCGTVALVAAAAVVYNLLNGLELAIVLLIPAFLAVVFALAFVKVISSFKKRKLEYEAVCYAVRHNNYSVMSFSVTEKHYYRGTDDENDNYYLHCGDLILTVTMTTYKNMSVGSKVTAAVVNADGIEYFYTIGYKAV